MRETKKSDPFPVLASFTATDILPLSTVVDASAECLAGTSPISEDLRSVLAKLIERLTKVAKQHLPYSEIRETARAVMELLPKRKGSPGSEYFGDLDFCVDNASLKFVPHEFPFWEICSADPIDRHARFELSVSGTDFIFPFQMERLMDFSSIARARIAISEDQWGNIARDAIFSINRVSPNISEMKG